MLWYKSWLETRYRLLVLFIFTLVMVSLQHYSVQDLAMKTPPQAIIQGLSIFFGLWSLSTFAMMAGAGITTQTLMATKGLHGSMQYTLALPVSRLRMVMVRAGMGWVEGASATAVLCCAMWMLYPAIRATGTPVEMAEYAGTLIACGSSIYFLSVLLATLLDDQARAFGSIFLIVVLWWISMLGKIPASVDIFRVMGRGSQLITHTISWTPIGFSLSLSVVLLFAALQVARMREY